MDNFTLTINGVTNMPNLKASEKLVMIHLFTLKSLGIDISNVESSSKQLSYTRQGYAKILKRLIKMNYVVQVKRGSYSIAETKIY
jgi:DNA-binding MarR family transcriptional regulator|tara:strand:- start:493 stop:747 length:255 start_codon:yes stop_codon:yes gene_type:complete